MSLNQLCDVQLGFKQLSSTQIVTFILGIVFSLLAVAAIFTAFKYGGKIKSKTKIILLTMVLPFIAIASWLILIFSFVDGFKQDDILNIFVSIALSLVICFMILMVAYVLYNKHKASLEKEEVAQVEETQELTPMEENSTADEANETFEESDEEVEIIAEDAQLDQEDTMVSDEDVNEASVAEETTVEENELITDHEVKVPTEDGEITEQQVEENTDETTDDGDDE